MAVQMEIKCSTLPGCPQLTTQAAVNSVLLLAGTTGQAEFSAHFPTHSFPCSLLPMAASGPSASLQTAHAVTLNTSKCVQALRALASVRVPYISLAT